MSTARMIVLSCCLSIASRYRPRNHSSDVQEFQGSAVEVMAILEIVRRHCLGDVHMDGEHGHSRVVSIEWLLARGKFFTAA